MFDIIQAGETLPGSAATIAMTFSIGLTVGLTGAMAPGPTLLATVNSSLKDGWLAGPKVAAGHALIEMVIFLLIVKGLAVAMQEYSRLIALTGGLALILFGILTMRNSRSATMASAEGGSQTNPYLAGMLTSAANPYFWIWWLSIGSALVISGLEAGLMVAAIFMLGHWSADFGWYLLVSSSLDRGRSLLSPENYRRILGLCGIFLVLFGIYYLGSGVGVVG
ncbi:MAG: LysE family transporter [Methanothrix sp.]|uniref:LysE family transporter n=1 Tax=Methanothrix sp. TaxID=90426 RepID=UPI0025CDB1BE|nr:LysE family transporter [Methanothrix sp.]MBK7386152.1 LysE family transporter [Methanothrix sp.]